MFSCNTCTLQDIQEYLNLRYLVIDKGIALELSNLFSCNNFEVTLFQPIVCCIVNRLGLLFNEVRTILSQIQKNTLLSIVSSS